MNRDSPPTATLGADRLHLRDLRAYEVDLVAPLLPSSGRLLEIGAGNGWQAKLLSARGLAVTAVDVRDSEYFDEIVFPVTRYDGGRLPFRDRLFDAVFTSNVLEHVNDRGLLQSEIHRVLRDGGVVVHILPTPAWRIWASVGYYARVTRTLLWLASQWIRSGRGPRPAEMLRSANRPTSFWGWRRYLWPRRHGEVGNWMTEIYWFSRHRWEREFRQAGFDVTRSFPSGLFYSGESVLGRRLGLEARERLAPFLGSAGRIYRLIPKRPRAVGPRVRD